MTSLRISYVIRTLIDGGSPFKKQYKLDGNNDNCFRHPVLLRLGVHVTVYALLRFSELNEILRRKLLATNVFSEGHHINQRILDDQLPIGIGANSSIAAENGSLAETNASENSFIPISHVKLNTTALPKTDEASKAIYNENEPINVNIGLNTANDTEIEDLLHRNDVNEEEKYIQNYQHPFEPEIPVNYPDKIDKEVERIEDSEKTEDELRRHKDENVSDEPHGPLAAVLISMFVALAVLSYAVLLIWRRYLENKYGSRTLLVEDEELADPNNMKHFSI